MTVPLYDHFSFFLQFFSRVGGGEGEWGINEVVEKVAPGFKLLIQLASLNFSFSGLTDPYLLHDHFDSLSERSSKVPKLDKNVYSLEIFFRFQFYSLIFQTSQ